MTFDIRMKKKRDRYRAIINTRKKYSFNNPSFNEPLISVLTLISLAKRTTY